MTIADNVVAHFIRRHARQTGAVAVGITLLNWVYHASPGPARLAAALGAVLFFWAAFVTIPRHERRQPVIPPPTPDNPDDHYAYLAYIEALVLDTRAEQGELDQRVDTFLNGLESSANGVSLTARRLRRNFPIRH